MRETKQELSIKLSVKQTAELLGETERATWLKLYRRRLPHHRNGRCVFILRAELEAYLRACPGVSVEEALKNAELGGAR